MKPGKERPLPRPQPIRLGGPGLWGLVVLNPCELESNPKAVAKIVRLCVLALAFLWSTTSGAEECRDDATGRIVACPISVRGLAGPMGAIATDAETKVEPYISLQVQAPLSTSARGPRLSTQLELIPLQGEAVGLSAPTTFKALELGVAVVQPLPRPMLFSVYLEGGFASRLATSEEPVTRLPGWWSFGLVFATKDGDHLLRVGMGPDERLSGDWAATIHVSGRAKVGERGGVSLYLVGSAIRALDLSAYGYRTPARDSIRVGIAVGS